MKPFNCVETIVILVCKQLALTCFKMKLPIKYVSKQMTDVKLSIM